MGSTSFMVANGFSEDVWVKADSVLVQEHASSKNFSAVIKVRANVADTLPGVDVQGGVGFNAASSGKTVLSKFMEIGFAKMSKGNVTTFKPAQNTTTEDMKIVYVTIGYYDSDGKEQYLASNHGHDRGHSLIITKEGGIVDSKGKGDPWVDLNGKHHYCKDCLAEGITCIMCLVDDNLTQIEKSITAVQNSDVAHSLMMAVAKISMEEIEKKETAAVEILQDIKKLAENYRILEAETKRSVRAMKNYGKKLVVAAEEYVEDGDISELLQEMGGTAHLRTAIEKANNQHEVIKGDVKIIEHLAEVQESNFKQKAEERRGNLKNMRVFYGETQTVRDVIEYEEDCKEAAKAMVEDGVNSELPQEAEGKKGMFEKIKKGIEDFRIEGSRKLKLKNENQDRLVHEWNEGSKKTAVLGLFFFQPIVNHLYAMDAKNFKIMENTFKSIGQQMLILNDNLDNIIKSIDEIETNLNNATDAEEKFVRQTQKEMLTEKADREKRAGKLIERANSLIDSCDNYFLQMKKAQNVSAGIEQMSLKADIEELLD